MGQRMKNHTRGPWKAGEFAPNHFGGTTITGSDRIIIAKIIARDGHDANARLIAAAPELLEALEAIEKSLSPAFNPCEETTIEFSRTTIQHACNQARAAIARATGK